MTFTIRPYHPSDLSGLYRICLLTGDNGRDASQLYNDPDLLGHYYAAPYAVYEPDMCFTLTHDGAPCGYILGTRDTVAFSARCERDWLPILRERYPLPDADDSSANAWIIRMIHDKPQWDDALQAYPAHLHIDLLPIAQGQGLGRQMIQTFLNRLRELNVPGVHLGVSKGNPGAVAFYARVGFHIVKEWDGGIIYGMLL